MKRLTTLRQYLSLQLGMVAVLPVALIAVLAWLILMPQMRTTLAVHHMALARAISGQISAHLAGGERQLTALADYVEEFGIRPGPQLTVLLDNHCGESDLFEAIYRVDRGTKTIAGVGLARPRRYRRGDLEGMDLSGLRFFHEARQEEGNRWSEAFLSTASNRWAVALTVPRPGGVLIGEITLDQLSSLIRELSREAGLLALVLDPQGRVVADSRQTGWGGQLRLDRLPASPAEDGRRHASAPFELDGRKLLGTLVDVEAIGWRVLVAQPEDSAFRPQRSAFYMITVSLGLALAAALALAWLRAGNLSQIFRIYGEHAQAIAQGEYDLQWPVAKTAEFHHLGQGLEHMARRIRQREKDLVESESRMRITLDSIGDAVIATDAEGAITSMNPAAERLTGWLSAEAADRPLAEVFHIVDARTRRPVTHPVEKVLARGKVVGRANHTLLIGRDGREIRIADSGAPIRHTDGRIDGVVMVFRDITEEYAREKKIRENEARLRTITANVPGAVFQFHAEDQNYTIEFISEKARDMFDIDAGPLTFFDAFLNGIPDDEKAHFVASIQDAVARVAPWHYEGRYVKPEGETIWFSGQTVLHKSGSGVVAYGVLMDITRRRQMEESLHLAYFSLENASIGIFRIGEGGEIISVNKQACRSLGYSKEELGRMTVFDIDPDFNPRIWPEHIQNLRRAGTRSIETRHRRKDGEIFPVQILMNLMTFQGREYHVAFVEDISQRKSAETEAQRLEEALLQARKMEALGTLAGGVAHDFNNILSAVIGYSELALAENPSAPRLERNLEQILTAGLRARDLVQQILTFSRKDERALRPLHAGPLVKEALKLIRSSLPATIEMEQEIAVATDPVEADPTQIHQIVMNLCTNAAQAMEENGGRLKVSLAQVCLAETDIRLHPGLKPGDHLRIRVQDTGRGIPPEILPRIFRPLFHHQGARQGDRTGHGGGSRHRPELRRFHQRLQRAGLRDHHQCLCPDGATAGGPGKGKAAGPAPGQRAHSVGGRRGDAARRGTAAAGAARLPCLYGRRRPTGPGIVRTGAPGLRHGSDRHDHAENDRRPPCRRRDGDPARPAGGSHHRLQHEDDRRKGSPNGNPRPGPQTCGRNGIGRGGAGGCSTARF